MPNTDLLLSRLASTLSLQIERSYLQNLLTAPNFTLPANETVLLATLRFRILNSDFTEILHVHTNTCFPQDLHTNLLYQSAAQAILPGPLACQVVDIQDLSSSALEQLERIEEEERGEYKKGQEVIRVVPREEPEGSQLPPALGGQQQAGMPERKASRGPHKVLMEDAAGRRAWGFEVEKVPGIEIGGKMRLGAKVILRSVPIARGLLLLQPSNTTVLGGKVEAWDNAWAQKRKESLKAAVERAKSE